MRTLVLFLFFGIIYANKDRVHSNKILTNLVNKLRGDQYDMFHEIEALKVEIDELKTDRTNQQSRIHANEADISGNKANIFANSVDLQALTAAFNNLVVFNTVMYASGPPMNPDVTITFQETETNIGNGMDSSTGIFTAPVSGTYFFSFSGYILPTSPHQRSILLRVVCQN